MAAKTCAKKTVDDESLRMRCKGWGPLEVIAAAPVSFNFFKNSGENAANFLKV